jgi:long-chain fatty acid transport protein
LNTRMGLAADYGDSWAGRYFLEKTALITLNLNPAVSYRVTDWLSVGGGFSVVGRRYPTRRPSTTSILLSGTASSS